MTYKIQSTTLTEIGNALRTKEGSSGLIPVPDVAARILALPSGGSDIEIVDVYTRTSYPKDIGSAVIVQNTPVIKTGYSRQT